MYECHTVGVDAVKRCTLVVMIEIVDIDHHLRIKIPMMFQRLDLSLETMKGKTYCFGPGKRRQDYHTKHCGACFSLKWCLYRIPITTVAVYHCQNPEKLNSMHSLGSVFLSKGIRGLEL